MNRIPAFLVTAASAAAFFASTADAAVIRSSEATFAGRGVVQHQWNVTHARTSGNVQSITGNYMRVSVQKWEGGEWKTVSDSGLQWRWAGTETVSPGVSYARGWMYRACGWLWDTSRAYVGQGCTPPATLK